MNAKTLLEKANEYQKQNDCHIDWAIGQIIKELTDEQKISSAREIDGESLETWADSLEQGSPNMPEHEVRNHLIYSLENAVRNERMKALRGW